MDLIDRYVHRVKFFLPGKQRDDIARELAAGLRAEVQDKESAIGRPLDDNAVRVILKRWGHPVLVAGRYLPAQYLIGPTLFPIYWFVLKMVALFYLIPWFVIWVGLMILSPSYRAAHIWLAALGPLSTWWSALVGAFGTVTLVFAVLERVQSRAGLLDTWDPARLPIVHDRHVISRFASVGEIVGGLVFVLWLTGRWHFPAVGWGTPVSVTLSSSVWAFYWPVLSQVTFGLLVSGVNLFRPWWTLTRAIARLATNLALVAIAASLLQAGPWVVVDAPAMAPAARQALDRVFNLGAYWSLLGVGLVAFLFACLEDGPRVYRLVSERNSDRT